MAEPGWYEVTVVVRTTPELLAQARSAIEGSDLVDVDTWEVTPLDDARCRWDGSTAGTLLGVPEPMPTSVRPHPVFDRLRRGHSG